MSSVKGVSGMPVIVDDGHGFTMSCCGCKLSHFIYIKMNKPRNTVTLTFYLDEHTTKRMRRKKRQRWHKGVTSGT